MLDLRPPGFEFRILCLKDSVISFISPSSGGSPGPVQPICAQRWPKAQFISFHFIYIASFVIIILSPFKESVASCFILIKYLLYLYFVIHSLQCLLCIKITFNMINNSNKVVNKQIICVIFW